MDFARNFGAFSFTTGTSAMGLTTGAGFGRGVFLVLELSSSFLLNFLVLNFLALNSLRMVRSPFKYLSFFPVLGSVKVCL